MEEYKPDRLDRQLLDLLQKNNMLTAEQLAEHVALSASAIARRIRNLRSAGAIQADVAVVAPWAAGARLSVLLHVYLDRHSPRGGLEALRRHVLDCEQVQMCLEVSGSHDLVILITVADMAEFNRFVDTRLGENPIVQRYESSFVKKLVKLTTAMPVRQID